jgi:uncharacterized RDD family membrane protein YckC
VSSRKPGYLLGILILAVLCSLPHFIVVIPALVEFVTYRRIPYQLQFLHNWGRVFREQDLISSAEFWQDRFVELRYLDVSNGAVIWKVGFIDPRTRTATYLNGKTPETLGPQALTFGSRLWVMGYEFGSELIDGQFQSSSMVHPRMWLHEQQRFLLAGEPAFVEFAAATFTISTLTAGGWGVSHELVLPDSQPTTIDGIPIDFKKASKATCINQGDRLHLFLDVEGRLLHHEGLELRAAASNVGLPDQPVSALNAANKPADVTGWTVVNKVPMQATGTFVGYPAFSNKFGMFVEGKPAAIVVDTADASAVVGHLFRLENGQWSEFATQTFPFGTSVIRAVTRQDHQSSFVLAKTSAGLAHLYEVTADGIQVIPRSQTLSFDSFMAWQSLTEGAATLVVILLLGGIYALGATILMGFYTRPDYGFGWQQVKLAPILRRALARSIDLGLIGLSTVALAWWLTRDMDWLSLIEALNLKVSHPAVESATRIVCTLLLWLVVCEGLIVVAQARWGLTVGKWCCDLRVHQTSMRPCGLARSLVRELLLYVDACSFLCWTPGITSIALTDHRQRLGDIIGDTIVVAKPTMTQPQSRNDEAEKSAAGG